jgi:hypothetical protein
MAENYDLYCPPFVFASSNSFLSFWPDVRLSSIGMTCRQFSYISLELARQIMLYIPYILESNPHPFYSFRELKNQMRIRIECGLDLQSRAGFWKNDSDNEMVYMP